MPGPYTLVLLGATFVLSALWAAVLLVLARLHEREPGAAGARFGVELAWAVIPALIVLSVVIPALQNGWSLDGGPDDSDRMADVRAAP